MRSFVLRVLGWGLVVGLGSLAFVITACGPDGYYDHEVVSGSFSTDLTGVVEASEGNRLASRWALDEETRIVLSGKDESGGNIELTFFTSFDFEAVEAGDEELVRAEFLSPTTRYLVGELEVHVVAVNTSWRPFVCDTVTLEFFGEVSNDGVTQEVTGTLELESEAEYS